MKNEIEAKPAFYQYTIARQLEALADFVDTIRDNNNPVDHLYYDMLVVIRGAFYIYADLADLRGLIDLSASTSSNINDTMRDNCTRMLRNLETVQVHLKSIADTMLPAITNKKNQAFILSWFYFASQSLERMRQMPIIQDWTRRSDEEDDYYVVHREVLGVSGYLASGYSRPFCDEQAKAVRFFEGPYVDLVTQKAFGEVEGAPTPPIIRLKPVGNKYDMWAQETGNLWVSQLINEVNDFVKTSDRILYDWHELAIIAIGRMLSNGEFPCEGALQLYLHKRREENK